MGKVGKGLGALLAAGIAFAVFGSDHAKDQFVGAFQRGRLDRQCYNIWLDRLNDPGSAVLLDSYIEKPSDPYADRLVKEWAEGVMKIKVRAHNAMGGLVTDWQECPIRDGKVDAGDVRGLVFKRTYHY